MTVQFAPGMRVEIRDAEWRVMRVDHSSDGGHVITCEGLSELVRGREAMFLDRLDRTRVLDPAYTDLVDDNSANFGASLLYIDSMLRKTAPSDGRIHLGHRGALDQLPFQLEPALQALRQPRQRILIADAVGLGKTLEAGILTAELIARGRGKRILVLAVKSMLAQFQQEFWNRFTIPLVRLDSTGLQRVRNRIPTNHNPFHYFDRAIISIDTLKQDIEYRHHLEQAYWDIIIIDEVHNVAERGSGSQRARLARLLSTRSDTLIMLSATPHDGKPESFASLVNMLDPTAIANPSDYAQQDYRDKGLVIRRFKKDVHAQLRGNFPERQTFLDRSDASLAEENAYARLMEVSFQTLDGRGHGAGQLFRTTLEKSLFSSPAACLSMVDNRIGRLQRRLQAVVDDERRTMLVEDLDSLDGLRSALKAIDVADFSKYQLLCRLLEGALDWPRNDPDDRLVVFTESLVTLDFLVKHLPGDIGLKKSQVAVLRGDMRDSDLMDTLEQFNRRDSDVRLLLCSDVASEGINLHYLSHRLVHFDIPWSLMVFQQRNGRIDRYGQTRAPQIRYLLTDSQHPKVRGDQRILEVLIEKDDQAGKNIGDPSEFLGLFDRQAEEDHVAGLMEQDNGDDIWRQLEAMMDVQATQSDNPLAQFTPAPSADPTQQISALPRVFPDGLEYARAALRWLHGAGEKIDAGIEDDVFHISAPADLRQRLAFLPAEARPPNDRFMLTADKAAIQREIARARQDEDAAWPQLHYLWPLHPVMKWLSDRALNAFGRHAAPIVRLPASLAGDEHIVLIHGGFPNRRGHLLVQDWIGIHMRGQRVTGQLDWPALQQNLGLHPAGLPNPGRAAADTESLRALLPIAVAAARGQLQQARDGFLAQRREGLAAQQRRLEQLRTEHVGQLQAELDLSGQPEAIKNRRREQRLAHIDRIFRDHEDWLAHTQTTETEPYLQVVAVFTGQEAQP